MKKLFLVLSLLILSFNAAASQSHYVGENGRIVYSERIQPTVNERTYYEGRNLILLTTIKECIRTNSNRARLHCTQWRTRTEKRIVRGDNRRYNEHNYRRDWNRN